MDALTTGALFPSTHWSAVARASGGDDPASRQALGALLTRYLPAMKAFLRVELGLDAHRADDVLQSFVVERVMEQNLLVRADGQRGRFRTFLLACLRNHLAMQRRHESAAIRNPGAGRLGPLSKETSEELKDDAGSDVFDVAWARQVIDEALAQMRLECGASGRADLWALFEGRVVAPAMAGAAPLDYRQITAGRFKLATPAEATNALVTAKRMFLRMLRTVVAEYADGDEIDDELLRLKKVLAGAGSAPPRHT